MKRTAITALALCSLLGLCSLTSCSDKASSSSSAADTYLQGSGEVAAGGNGSSEDETASGSSSEEWPLESPEEGAMDYDLGDYRTDPETGIKLYYDDTAFSRELMQTLERYFLTFQNRDFEGYKEINYPEYCDDMETFLQKDYGYGLEESFNGQCDNLNDIMGGSFKITRVKAEVSEEYDSEQEGIDDFLEYMDEVFGSSDFSTNVKNSGGELRYFTFYIMAEDADGEESMLVSQFNTLFLLKDGKYYTFG